METHLPCRTLTCGNRQKRLFGAVESPSKSFQLLVFSSKNQSVPVGMQEVCLSMCPNALVQRLSELVAQLAPWVIPGMVSALLCAGTSCLRPSCHGLNCSFAEQLGGCCCWGSSLLPTADVPLGVLVSAVTVSCLYPLGIYS